MQPWSAPFTRVASVVQIGLATLSSYLLGYPLTAVLVCIGIVADLFDARGFIRGGLAFWGRLVFWLGGRSIHSRGTEHITQGRAYLVLANHCSMYDIPALLSVLPDLALVGREKLTRIPVFGRLLQIIRYVPIDTEKVRRARAAINEAVRRAAEGRSVGMFPEGTRSLDGKVQPLKRGFVYVLRESGLDVLPVTIHGTFTFKPKGRFTMDPRTRIEVTVHSPLAHGGLSSLSDKQIMDKVHSILDGGTRGEQ